MISRLLTHYWTAVEPPSVRQAQLEDWIIDLIEYPLDVVAEACLQWRRKAEPRRPIPGEIRALCIEILASRPSHLNQLPPPEDETETEIMRRADAWAKSHGYDSIDAFNRAGKSAWLKTRGGEWRHFAPQRQDPASEGRDLVNAWARKQGFLDMDDYTKAKFGEPGDPADSNANWFRAYQVYLAEFKAEISAQPFRRMPLARHEKMSEAAKQRLRDKSILRQAQEDLGISATESESKP